MTKLLLLWGGGWNGKMDLWDMCYSPPFEQYKKMRGGEIPVPEGEKVAAV